MKIQTGWKTMALLGAVLLASSAAPLEAGVILLNADSVATGSTLDTTPLVTEFGTITATNLMEIRPVSDPEFIAAGATGDVFDIFNNPISTAEMQFDFDVDSLDFIFGGNMGVFDIIAFDEFDNLVDSFYQADTYAGQHAGAVTLSGGGIRRVTWRDPGNSYAAIDNVSLNVNAVPEPATLAIFGSLGLVALGRRRRA